MNKSCTQKVYFKETIPTGAIQFGYFLIFFMGFKSFSVFLTGFFTNCLKLNFYLSEAEENKLSIIKICNNNKM